MPRLSVDIDLTYLPLEERATSLSNIDKGLEGLQQTLKSILPANTSVQKVKPWKLLISAPTESIKIEANTVLRGTLHPPTTRPTADAVSKEFGLSLSVPVTSFADVYGGKLCAALDRQHPRDLFDVKLLMENEGITDEVRTGFVIYLASNDRPIHELLQPNEIDIRSVFKAQFENMAIQPVTIEELVETRSRLVSHVRENLTKEEREFLISIKMGEPKWDLLPFPNLENLPGLQWKLVNIQKMKKELNKKQLEALRRTLEV